MIIFTISTTISIFIISIIITATATLAFQIPPIQPRLITTKNQSSLYSSFKAPPIASQATEQNQQENDDDDEEEQLLLEGECLDDWEIALYESQPSEDSTVSKDSILRHTFVADLLADGSLDSSEIEDIWTESVGKDIDDSRIDVDTFMKFWYAVDELFAKADDPNLQQPEEEDEDAIKEVWLDQLAKESYYSDDDTSPTLAECIRFGEVVLVVPNVATESELQSLFSAGYTAYQNDARPEEANRRSRFPARSSVYFPSIDTTLTAESILLGTFDVLDESVPSIFEEMFLPSRGWAARQPLNARMEQPSVEPPAFLADTCSSLRDLYMAGELEFSEGEPAINIYHEGGYFGAHKDHLGLTVLLPLTLPSSSTGGSFMGGGTGFWAGNRATSENPMVGATEVIRPDRLGCALVFGGDVTHSGVQVEGGVRGVFVASCSTRTEVSALDRVKGLQRDEEEF